MDWINIISSVGFPIVACAAMAYYVKYSTDSYKEQLEKVNEAHKAEVSDLSEAIQNNTLAIQKLCDYLERGE